MPNLSDALAILRSIARQPPIEYREGSSNTRCVMCKVFFSDIQDEHKLDKHMTHCAWRLAREFINQRAPEAPDSDSDSDAAFEAFRVQVDEILAGLLREFFNESFRAIHSMTIDRHAQINATAELKGHIVAWHIVIQEYLGVDVHLPFPYQEDTHPQGG